MVWEDSILLPIQGDYRSMDGVSLEWWSILRVYERLMWIGSNLLSALSTAGTEKSQYHASVESCHCCEFQQATCIAERWIGDVSELMKEPLTKVMISNRCSSWMEDDGLLFIEPFESRHLKPMEVENKVHNGSMDKSTKLMRIQSWVIDGCCNKLLMLWYRGFVVVEMAGTDTVEWT